MSGVFCLLLCGAVYLWYRRRQDRLTVYRLEPYLKIREPIPLCGAPDVVWLRKGSSTLIVGDYKSRVNRRIYESDIIQLSVYRFLLLHTQEKAVADYGYIHFSDGSRRRVKLLREKQLGKLYERYRKILAGAVEPEKVFPREYCRHCSHRAICDKKD